MAVKSLTSHELRIWRAFQLMGEAVLGRVGRDIFEATGLSGPEFGVLSRLVGIGMGEMRQQTLAKVMAWEKSRLSHQLTRMKNRGLIRRKNENGAVLIALTKNGRNKLAEALPVRAESVKRHFLLRLSREQIDTLLQVSSLLCEEE